VISFGDQRPTSELDYLRDHFGDKIQKVEFHFQLAYKNLHSMTYVSILLSDWASKSTLKSICFRLEGPNALGQFKYLGKISRIPRGGCCSRSIPVSSLLFKILRRVKKHFKIDQENNPRPVVVDLRLEIDLGVETLGAVERREWLKELSMEKSESALEQASRYLGGEVWVDGMLCYKNGETIRTVFREWEADMHKESEMLNRAGPWEGNYYELLAED